MIRNIFAAATAALMTLTAFTATLSMMGVGIALQAGTGLA